MSPPKTQALAEGTLGGALLHIERHDLATARSLLTDAVAGGVSTGANASLFHGAPALEFVLGRAGHAPRDVQDAVDRIIFARLAAAHQRRESARFPFLAEFDLVRGIAGLGAVLLTRSKTPLLMRDVLTYLVSLAQPIDTADGPLPGWWSQDSRGQRGLAGGYSNNGVAHGIAGPLALLSLTARRDIEVEGQVDAIDALSRWLDGYGALYWVTRNQLAACTPPQPPLLRPSWCYGEVGIAHAQQLAAIAMGDSARRKAAEDTVVAALTDPARLRLITDASLCHGWAGLLVVTRAIAADSPRPGRFAEHVEQLAARLTAGIEALAKPGFMEGLTGARLALNGTNTTSWTRALLID